MNDTGHMVLSTTNHKNMRIKQVLITFFLFLGLYNVQLIAQKNEIRIFQDKNFSAMPEYNADDVAKLFKSQAYSFSTINHRQLEKLEYPETRLLLLPYLKGNFSATALQAMIRFHEDGGGLFFIGDLPNKDKWYPLRNMQSPEFHLTRAGGGIRVEGLTEEGKKILKKIPSLDFFKNRTISSIRVTAYPPDITHNLIQNNSDAWALYPVIAVERKCDKFFGARLGVLGSNGGEPRENVDGAYHMEWEWDPGMLSRDWIGCDTLILNLAKWIYNTPDLAGSIDLIPVHKGKSGDKIILRFRNLSSEDIILKNIVLKDVQNSTMLLRLEELIIPGGSVISAAELDSPKNFGYFNYVLNGELNGEIVEFASAKEYVIPDDAADFQGYGYSTYWAFQKPEISEPFKYFTRQMKGMGLQYVRANIPWEDVEPEPGIYDWRIPTEMLEFAEEVDLPLAFWMFATTRGSGLGDGGVPWWSLKEPAIDRDGNKGFHPTLWSPFYRKHYFGMIDEFTKQFASSDYLMKFVLDFGNSDFPYGYNYYVNPPHLFDYSAYEKEAFSRYLRNNLDFTLPEVSLLYKKTFEDWNEVSVPYIEEVDAWRIYLNFRRWSVQNGMQTVAEICKKNAPEKLPKDLPGHGLGSISDLSASWYDVKARHWNEEKKFDHKYTELHNSGQEWGGEPWQVGGTYKEFDDALYGSLRYNSNYFSIPAPDISADQEGIAKVGFIRRTIMGAEQTPAEIAILDMIKWNDYQSSALVGARMDQRVDLLGQAHRFDFSCYKLLVLPNDELRSSIGTVTTGGSILPIDEQWYWLLRESVEKGLTIVVFPNTCLEGRTPIPLSFLREVMQINDVEYGERELRKVIYSGKFGGGSVEGKAVSVKASGEVLLKDDNGEAVLVRREFGKGAILLAGWDNQEDSFDGKLNYFEQENIGNHTLIRLASSMDLMPKEIVSEQLNILKALVRRNNKEYLLLYSHVKDNLEQEFKVKLHSPSSEAYDLATGELFPVKDLGKGWYSINLSIYPRVGRYLSFHDR
jgi:hypothetical protein